MFSLVPLARCPAPAPQPTSAGSSALGMGWGWSVAPMLCLRRSCSRFKAGYNKHSGLFSWKAARLFRKSASKREHAGKGRNEAIASFSLCNLSSGELWGRNTRDLFPSSGQQSVSKVLHPGSIYKASTEGTRTPQPCTASLDYLHIHWYLEVASVTSRRTHNRKLQATV